MMGAAEKDGPSMGRVKPGVIPFIERIDNNIGGFANDGYNAGIQPLCRFQVWVSHRDSS
eukprot:m.136008 g.136008  ORF g.136008 m.136008 type:complete len:59 (-) comp16016_c0_seq6:90-266(-)